MLAKCSLLAECRRRDRPCAFPCSCAVSAAHPVGEVSPLGRAFWASSPFRRLAEELGLSDQPTARKAMPSRLTSALLQPFSIRTRRSAVVAHQSYDV